MRIFDFNIHFPINSLEEVDKIVDTERGVSPQELSNRIEESNYEVDGANIMIFNTDFKNHQQVRSACSTKYGHHMITQLINPDNYEKDINSLDIDAIKFHPYQQDLTRKDYGKILHICNTTDKVITLDTSYGSSKMYKNNPMELACLIADEVKDKPIVLLHSGGLKCMEAMLLAESQDNIWLETSLSYSYYHGSRVAEDLKYIYKKVGADRILFASDSPYFDLQTQVTQIDSMMTEIGFGSEEKHKVFYENAVGICQ
jgi:hypothetical protein